MTFTLHAACGRLDAKPAPRGCVRITVTKKNQAAVELGRLGGRVKSEAKTKAVRENGRKGGRPKKAQRRK